LPANSYQINAVTTDRQTRDPNTFLEITSSGVVKGRTTSYSQQFQSEKNKNASKIDYKYLTMREMHYFFIEA